MTRSLTSAELRGGAAPSVTDPVMPARVSPARLPDTPHLGWAMVNLGLLTLLGGALSRLF
ncbi:hypothetical protein [Deinococcus radiodurans]|jgi:hypothetical protein|uniref:hypothetical protein n=1 Tax=Deinococcus radiodurans TaxID=1299 RepID=UPI00030219A0|nr:hypothetical protein [Deinococcus radiodurans]ANC72329.1 hypothetical protein A2G07_11425 [Deinococcus radiodurans R1 = ATCC 13939 = DSM 20539]QEM72374.1 hypothetical protein DXG80_11765 [Deinococcus radiodurans]QIP32686.1 hypothetical protein HAV35_11830 [Deinococcus radiodurans]UDK99608.1 hypothetical protein E5E91_02170 [Deinococcus radiodurans R1 = ATCC 13939 = DSM 20539]UTA50007.1 hypothetical protein MSS93_09355 [Deinococcus radiodurans]